MNVYDHGIGHSPLILLPCGRFYRLAVQLVPIPPSIPSGSAAGVAHQHSFWQTLGTTGCAFCWIGNFLRDMESTIGIPFVGIDRV